MLVLGSTTTYKFEVSFIAELQLAKFAKIVTSDLFPDFYSESLIKRKMPLDSVALMSGRLSTERKTRKFTRLFYQIKIIKSFVL